MVLSLAAVVAAGRRAARDEAGLRPTASTVDTLGWLEETLDSAATPCGPGFEDLLRAVERRAEAVNPSRSRSVKLLLAAALAMVAEALPTARTVPATLWVMVHDRHPGVNVFAVTSDGRRFLAAYAIGDSRWSPRAVVDVGSDARGAAVERTRKMEADGYTLCGAPAVGRLLDLSVGSLVDLVRAAVEAGWPSPSGWPDAPPTPAR